MKLRYLTGLLGLLMCIKASCQNVDSLLQVLEEPFPRDSAAIDQYIFAAFEYHTIHPDLCEKLSTKALQGAEHIGYIGGQALAKTNLGLVEWVRHNLTKSMGLFFEAKELHRSINNQGGMAAINSNLGMIYDELEDLDMALKYYFETVRILKEINKEHRMATVLANIGVAYRKKNEPDSALKYYFDALELRKKDQNKKAVSGLYNNIALVYYRHYGEKDQAFNYYQKAVEIKKVIKDTFGLSRTYLNIGNIHHEAGAYNRADHFYQQGLALAEAIKSKKQTANHLYELSSSARKQGKWDQSIEYLDKYYAVRLEMEKEQKGDEIKQLELRNDLNEKEHTLAIVNRELEIIQAQQALEVQRRNILIAAILFIVILGAIAFMWLKTRIERGKARQALMQSELENARLHEQELERELEFKSRELTSYTINFLRKNQLMEELQSISQNLSRPSLQPDQDNIKKLDQLIRRSHNVDKDWNDFKSFFEGVHPQFFKSLTSMYPDLTNAEIKLCALVKLNMNIKEISEVLGISPESVKTARHRLRKKLNLEDPNENLTQFVSRIGDQVQV